MDSDTDGKETPEQRAPVERVMQEFKEFELKSDSAAPVEGREQAMPSAPKEAAASHRDAPEENAEALDAKDEDVADATTEAEIEGEATQEQALAKGAARRARPRRSGRAAAGRKSATARAQSHATTEKGGGSIGGLAQIAKHGP